MSDTQEKLEKIKEELSLLKNENINENNIGAVIEISKQINDLWGEYQNKDISKKRSSYHLILEMVTKKLQNCDFKLYRFSGYELILIDNSQHRLGTRLYENFSRSEIVIELILSDKEQEKSIELNKVLKINLIETTEQEIDYYSDLIIKTIVQKNIELIQGLALLSDSISKIVLSINKR